MKNKTQVVTIVRLYLERCFKFPRYRSVNLQLQDLLECHLHPDRALDYIREALDVVTCRGVNSSSSGSIVRTGLETFVFEKRLPDLCSRQLVPVIAE